MNALNLVIKIFPEPAVCNRLVKVYRGGGEDTYVDVDHTFAAQTEEFLILQHVQQLGLKVGGQVRHFIQQNGSLIAQFELARFRRYGSGESAALATKQFAFQYFLG